MGREIRMVPPHWEHPKEQKYDIIERRYEDRYKPMFDWPFAPAMQEWYEAWCAWERGERPKGSEDTVNYWDWDGGPPDPAYYRPDWKDGEATWCQMYETVSEGSPVTPPFATKAELIDYLVANGDFWDQKRGAGGWERKNAEKFVESGWAPSFTALVKPDGTSTGILAPRDGSAL